MATMKSATIRTAPELYAHAIALEREAAERYAEFALRMSDRGNDALASLFSRLASIESEHLATLVRRTAGVPLPVMNADQYRWLDAGAPETAARELVFRLMTERQALAIALDAEKRAQAFFEDVLYTASDPALRSLAREMMMEEAQHVAMVADMIRRTAGPVDWEKYFEQQPS